MTPHTWDAIVIGGGAAGLSAAQALGRARRRTLVIDAGSTRNRFAAGVHNVLGHDGKSPAELVAAGRADAERYGVEFLAGRVESVTEIAGSGTAGSLQLTLAATGDATEPAAVLTTRALIVASGATDVLPEIPGLAEHWGSSVMTCPYCHGWEVRDRRLGVITTSPMGMHQAKLLRQWSDDVTVFSAGLVDVDAATAAAFSARGVKLVASPVVEVQGDGAQLAAVITAGDETWPIDAVFTTAAVMPHDAFLSEFEFERQEIFGCSYIVADAMGQTAHSRIWAVGNVVQPTATVPVSMGAGAMAGAAANYMLLEEDYAHAVAAQGSINGKGQAND